MSIAAQTITRDDARDFAFVRDTVFAKNRDHVFNHDPLTALLFGRNLGPDFGAVNMAGIGKRTQVGGVTIRLRVRLGEHEGSKFMAGPFDTHSVTPDDNTRFATVNWVHASGALVVTDFDRGINRGDDAMASFIEDQTQSVMLSLVQTLGKAAQTTSPAANAITSLDDLIAAGSSSVQGLSASTFPRYASRGLSPRDTAPGSVSFASGSFAAQGISDMRTCYNNAMEGIIQPNAIITTYNIHEFYEGVLQPLERFQGAVSVADGSFQALAFRKTAVMASPHTPSGYMWMLRIGDDGLQVVYLDGFDFEFAPFKPGSNQEIHVSELQWKGNQILHNRQYGSNKMTSITA